MEVHEKSHKGLLNFNGELMPTQNIKFVDDDAVEEIP